MRRSVGHSFSESDCSFRREKLVRSLDLKFSLRV